MQYWEDNNFALEVNHLICFLCSVLLYIMNIQTIIIYYYIQQYSTSNNHLAYILYLITHDTITNLIKEDLMTLIGLFLTSLTDTNPAIASTIHWGDITTLSLRKSWSKNCTTPMSWKYRNTCFTCKRRTFVVKVWLPRD